MVRVPRIKRRAAPIVGARPPSIPRIEAIFFEVNTFVGRYASWRERASVLRLQLRKTGALVSTSLAHVGRTAASSPSAQPCAGMTDDREPEILGNLPRTRPHRRSDKRSSAGQANGRRTAASAKRSPNGTSAARKPAAAASRARSQPLRQPKQPAGAPPAPSSRRPRPASGSEIASTLVQAAGELAEIGLSAGARAIRNALARLPRP